MTRMSYNWLVALGGLCLLASIGENPSKTAVEVVLVFYVLMMAVCSRCLYPAD